MKTIVIVPYRPDRGHRDRLWKFLRDNYWNHQPHQIVMGEYPDDGGSFNRSKAINAAAVGEWDMAVITDSDTWVPAKQLHQALMTAKISGRLTAAFDAVVELSQPCTDDVLTGRLTMNGSFGANRVRTRDLETQSSMLVVPRALWDSVGGFDERFAGWGCEDNAFWHSCRVLGGDPNRLSGNAYHLWHSPARGKHHGIEYKRNLNLWRRYEAAVTADDLRAVQG